MLSALVFTLAQLAAAAPGDSLTTGARSPAYTADGRLALSIRGDIWVRGKPGDPKTWTQLTSGAAWDQYPVWSADGSSIVFTSTRSGTSHLYRIATAGGDAERLTSNTEAEGEAAISRDGSLVYARGRGSQAKLWIRTAGGDEKRFTRGDNGGEHWPVFSPDGRQVAYSAVREDRTRLRVHIVAGDSDRVVVEDRDAEHAAWSPAGDRIAFATRNGRAGVWITTPDAKYVNMISAQRAEPAWSPDGRTMALVELPQGDVGYNGDPDRLGDRELRDDFSTTGRLWFVNAPTAPDAGLATSSLPATDQRGRNADVFTAFWNRMDSLYFRESPARHARWDVMRVSFSDRALSATSDAALESVIHDMIRERPPLRDAATGHSAVSSAHPVATAAGLEILRKGGNVVDAAVAVSLALGVVEPDASGLGGYGQMIVSMKSMSQPQLIEFMTRAPEEATLANGALLRRGANPPDGPVLVNVPGTLAGMDVAFRKYGSRKVTWAEVVAPAIRAAEQGYVVSEGLATTLATEREHFLKYPGSRALFFVKGEPLHAGDSIRNPDLARTLRTIADSGAQSFYSGSIARRLVADLRGQGNAIRLTDMSRYYAAEREPVSGTYRGYTLYSSAPPVSGGATLVAQLNSLEQQNATRAPSLDAASFHAQLEAWKLVPAGRGRIADPGLWPVHIEGYTSKDSSRLRWRCFNARKALQPDDLRGDVPACAKSAVPTADREDTETTEGASEDSQCSDHAAFAAERFCHRTGTTAFAVADADGNVVSATQTLGTWGGNFYVSPGLGFLYNDKLGSYGNDPDEYGARLPNARHGSTLAPTIAFRGEGSARRPVVAAAAAGNAWITSAVFTSVTGVLDQHLNAQQAIELPRFLIGQQRGESRASYLIQIEDGFAPSVLRELSGMGHEFRRISLPGEVRMGYAAVITFGDHDVTAGADPRRAGAAGAVP
ncbi:MAG: gamma-glutamyltranspeptidase [Gemmatimonadetes bacterium]|nr:gamma-glutamyltranspeptidase [Gemmatimonadota bacterium]